MNEKLGRIVTGRPAITVIVIILITFLFMMINANPGLFGLDKKDVESENQWLPDNKYVIANDEINDNYGVQMNFLTIIVQGRNGTVLTKDALIDILTVEKQIAENEKVQYILHPQQGNISSLSSAIAADILKNMEVAEENITYDLMLETLEGLDQLTIDNILTQAAQDVGMFLTNDFQMNLEKGVVRAKGTMMLIMLNSTRYDEIEEGKFNPILDADEEITKIFDETEFKGVKRMGIVEEEYINQQINEETGGVMGRLFMFVFILIIIILFLTYRSIFDTLISLLALVFAISWMNGVGVILGLTFSAMYEAVPIMLLGLGIDYAIHLVMRYREERDIYGKTIRDSLILTTLSVGAALFLATLTTGISFGSNTVSEIQPMREFAIFSLVGIVSAFIIMVTFVPASKMLYHTHLEPKISPLVALMKKRIGPLVVLLKERIRSLMKTKSKTSENLNNAKTQKNTDHVLARFLAGGSVAAEHHAYPVIAVVVIISLISTVLATQLTTEFNFTEFLPEGAQISEDIVYLSDNFQFGTEEGDVLIKGNIDDPEVLIAINETQKNILNDENVNERNPINSILTLMYHVAMGDNEGIDHDANFSVMYNASDNNGDGVPDSDIADLFNYLIDHDYREQTISVLHFVETENDTDGTKDREFDGAVIRVGVNTQNFAKAGEIRKDLENDIGPLEKLEEEGKIDQVIATGEPVLVNVIIHSIELSGLKSLVITVIVAGIILTFVFYITDKSLVLGILTEIPVILVIAWVFASMYIIGMPLNVMTIMIASLTVGLGITYGIHVTHRFVEDLSELNDIDKACRSTVTNTGTALFGAAITTIGGFGILIFAPIPPLQKFGAISSLSIAFSLIASVFVLPTFLSEWAKYVKKKDPLYFEHHADVNHIVEEHPVSSGDESAKEGKKRDMEETIPEDGEGKKRGEEGVTEGGEGKKRGVGDVAEGVEGKEGEDGEVTESEKGKDCEDRGVTEGEEGKDCEDRGVTEGEEEKKCEDRGVTEGEEEKKCEDEGVTEREDAKESIDEKGF